MATLFSRPSSLIVNPPIRTEFGTGGDAGRLEDDVWTPGRDANGIVNAASWAIAPRGRWLAVDGTRLDAMDAVVKRQIPAWRDWGTEGWRGVTDDWNGMAIDTAGNRMWLSGGGHAGSSNNGIYRFDGLRMAWAVEDMPSDPTPWSDHYKETGRRGGTFTFCKDANDLMKAKEAAGTLQAINDHFYDELPWDGKPASRHTYSSMVFAPESNELIMICRRLWRYSLTEKRWTYKRLIRDRVPLWLDGENMVAIHDEATGEVLVSAAGSSGIYNSTGYSLRQNQWTNWGSPWILYSNVADLRVDRRVVAFNPPSRRTTYTNAPGQYWDYNLNTRSLVTSGTVQISGGLSQNDFAIDSWFYDSAGLTYIPSLNRYWLYTLMANGAMEMIEINPTTTPWTARRAATVPGKVPVSSPRLERKMIFLPGLNAVLINDVADKNMFLYKV